jgi:hypothetical protein
MDNVIPLKLERECGECSACCVWFEIGPIAKEQNEPCKELCNPASEKGEHARTCGNSCGIYETRPTHCREYICAWLFGYGNEEDRPDKSGVILDNIEWVPGSIVAKQLWRSAAMTKRGRDAINRISNEMDKPVLVLRSGKLRGTNPAEQYIACVGKGY